MYAKLFSDIIASSLWSEDLATRVLFVGLLALADEDGVVRARGHGLARMVNLPMSDMQEALNRLMEPDPESKSKEEEGRRVIEIEDGYLLVNYKKYRDTKTSAERREETRKRVQRYRAHHKLNGDNEDATPVTPCNADVTDVTKETHSDSVSVSDSDKKQRGSPDMEMSMLVTQFKSKTKSPIGGPKIREYLQSAIDQGKDTAAISAAIEANAVPNMKPWEFLDAMFPRMTHTEKLREKDRQGLERLGRKLREEERRAGGHDV